MKLLVLLGETLQRRKRLKIGHFLTVVVAHLLILHVLLPLELQSEGAAARGNTLAPLVLVLALMAALARVMMVLEATVVVLAIAPSHLMVLFVMLLSLLRHSLADPSLRVARVLRLLLLSAVQKVPALH